MANPAAQKIEISHYKISGFNVVVTLPDGTQQVLKDGLADLILGNIELIDKNGHPISKEAILSSVNVKQNALDSAFLGDFIKSKTDNSDDAQERPNGEQQEALAQQALAKQQELQSIISNLNAQLAENRASDSHASAQINQLNEQNQQNIQKISQYLQQLQQVQTQVAVLKQQNDAQTEQLQSMKQTLPDQQLAETFKAQQQKAADNASMAISSGQDAHVSQPVPVSKVTPSSSASTLQKEDDRPTLKAQEVAIDKDKLKALEDTLKTTTDEKDKAQTENQDLKDKLDNATKDHDQLVAEKNQAAADKAQAEADKQKAEADKAQAEADKAQAEADKAQAEADKKNTDTTLKDLADAHFISDTLTVSAKLSPDSDHGNDNASSKTDNVTNETHPTFMGTADPNSTVTLTIRSNDGGTPFAITQIKVTPPSASADKTESKPDEAAKPTGTEETKSDTISEEASPVVAKSADGEGESVSASPSGEKGSATLDDTPDTENKANTSNAPGTWTFTIPEGTTLAPGHYQYTATAVIHDDKLGINKTSNPFIGTFVIDTTAPDAKVTAITNAKHDPADTTGNDTTGYTQWISGDLNAIFSGVTKPQSNSEITLTITKPDESQVTLEPVYSSPSGAWTVNPTKDSHGNDIFDASGIYKYSVKVVDDAGNTNTSNGTLSINTNDLFVNLHLAKESDSGIVGDNKTNFDMPTFEGTATKGKDASSGTPAAKVNIKLTIDGRAYTTTTDDQGKWSITTDHKVPDGVQAVQVHASDVLGKTADASTVVTIDTQPPAIDAYLDHASDTGLFNNDNITNITEPWLKGTTKPGAKVTILVYYNPTGKGYDAITQATEVVQKKGSNDPGFTYYTLTPQGNTPDGKGYAVFTRDVTAEANGDWSFQVPVTSQYTAAFLNPGNKWHNVPGAQFNVKGHASDGIYQYAIIATDPVGNHQYTDFDTGLQKFTIDTTPPTATVTIPSVYQTDVDPTLNPIKDYPVNSVTPALTVNTGQAGSKVTITYNDDKGNPREITGTADAQGTYNSAQFEGALSPYDVRTKQGGTKVHIQVEDPAGNTTDNDVTLKYAPTNLKTIPLTAILDPDSDSSHGHNVTNNLTPTIHGTSAPGATIDLSYTVNGGTPRSAGTTTVGADNNWHITLPKLENSGNSLIVFTVHATSGNGSNVAVGSFQLDTKAPELNLDDLSMVGPKMGNDGKNVTWKVDPAHTHDDVITLVTSDNINPESWYLATLTGTLKDQDQATVVVNADLRNNEVGNKPTDGDGNLLANNHWTNTTTKGWTTTDSSGNSVSHWAAGFNYDQSYLRNKDSLTTGDFPVKASDLNYTGRPFYPLVWPTDATEWSKNGSTITVTDVAGNSKTYKLHVKYDVVKPHLDTVIIDGAGHDGDGTYQSDHSPAQTFYTNKLNSITLHGKSDGASSVKLIDVSDKDDTWLADPQNLLKAVSDINAKVTTGSVNTQNPNDNWSVAYSTNLASGKPEILKVIPVLVNASGNIQNNLGYVKINVFQQDFDIAANLYSDKEHLASGGITDNANPILGGKIANYDQTLDSTLAGTISIDGKSAVPVTITLGKDGNYYWFYDTKDQLNGASTHNYEVDFKDQYGNSKQIKNSFAINQIYGALDSAGGNDSGKVGDGITNRVHPVLSGKVGAGNQAVVKYTDLKGEQHTVNTTTTTNGSWNGQITDTLKDGDYTFTLAQTKNGETIGNIQTYKFTIDTTPPTVTTGIDISKLSPQAADHAGNVFNSSPALKGTVKTDGVAEKDVPVTITVPVTVNGDTTNYTYTARTDATGQWTVSLNNSSITDSSLPELPDGTYTYKVTGQDVAGNTSPEASGSFTLDTTPPQTLEFGVKANALHTTSGTTLYTKTFQNSTLYGKVDKNDRVQIEFKAVVAPDDKDTITTRYKNLTLTPDKIHVGADGTWSVLLSDLQNIDVAIPNKGTEQNPDGLLYKATIEAIDPAGNIKSASFNYAIGKNPPRTDIEVYSDKNDAQTKLFGTDVNGVAEKGFAHAIFDPTPVFTGTTRPGSTVHLILSGIPALYNADPDGLKSTTKIDGTGFQTKADDDGVWSITIPKDSPLKSGNYYYAVTVTDENGLTNTIGDSRAGGSSSQGAGYNFSLDNRPVGVDVHMDHSLDSGDSDNDNYTAIRHQKIIGTSGALLDGLTIFISKDQPITSSNPGTQVNASDILDSTTHSKYDVYNNKGHDWYVDLNNLADGTYYVSVSARNALDRVDTSPLTFTVDTKPPSLDNVALSSTTDTGVVGDKITALSSPILTGSTKPGTHITLHVEDTQSDKTVVRDFTGITADNNGVWQATLNNLAPGKHKYWIEAKDIAGNTNTLDHRSLGDADPDYIIIQNTYDGPSDIKITSDLATASDTGLHDYITSDNTPVITGTAPAPDYAKYTDKTAGKDSGSPLSQALSEIFLDIKVGDAMKTYSGYNINGKYSIKITDKLPDGFYNYEVYAKDNAGNKSPVFKSPLHIWDYPNEKQYSFKVHTSTAYTDEGLTRASYQNDQKDNVTTGTLIGIHGKIGLAGNTTASDYSVTVSIQDLSAGGAPVALPQTVTKIQSNGEWQTDNAATIQAIGVHQYTVTITDRTTGTNTTYNGSFTIAPSTSVDTTTNTTLAEQHGNQPDFSGKAPAGTSAINLSVYKSGSSKAIETQKITNVSADGSWSYHSASALADGHYTYTLKTVNSDGIESTVPISGNLEVYTTNPTLHYVEQDTSVPQSGVTIDPNVLFYGKLDLTNDKYSKTLPTDTVKLHFKNFDINPTVDSNGKWQVTKDQYTEKLGTYAAADNTAYEVTVKDRFGNTTTDKGDLNPNDHSLHGNPYQPLFMGESEPFSTITINLTDAASHTQTATTQADSAGHWQTTWNSNLSTGSYYYSLSITTLDGTSYSTGKLGTVVVSTPTSTMTTVDSLLASNSASHDELSATGSHSAVSTSNLSANGHAAEAVLYGALHAASHDEDIHHAA